MEEGREGRREGERERERERERENFLPLLVSVFGNDLGFADSAGGSQDTVCSYLGNRRQCKICANLSRIVHYRMCD